MAPLSRFASLFMSVCSTLMLTVDPGPRSMALDEVHPVRFGITPLLYF